MLTPGGENRFHNFKPEELAPLTGHHEPLLNRRIHHLDKAAAIGLVAGSRKLLSH